MQFIKTADPTKGADALRSRIQNELASGKRVLWLISGGSAVKPEAEIINKIKQAGKTTDLTIMLMDERYGPVLHADSNWQQLKEAGADFTGLHSIPVLTEPLKSFDTTVSDYTQHIATALDNADTVIGLFGVGPDAHTAGILPHSPAAEDTTELVVGYEAAPLKRITLTRHALLKVDVGFAFTFAESKAQALGRLKNNSETFNAMPAKLLWEIPEVYVYNDQIGEAA